MADFGSDVLTKQDPRTRRIMLTKDGKEICHVKCDSHIELPLLWNITLFARQAESEKLPDCNHVHIYPMPNSTHQEREWRTFLTYLRDRVKVAVIRSEQYHFHILPPDKHANLDFAKVAYTVEEASDSCGDKKNAANGDTMAQIMNIVPLEASSHGNKTKRMHVTQPLDPNLASIHPSFLQNLGLAHDWIFAAIAELVDNSRDAKASRLHIFIENLYYNKVRTDIPMLSIVDDGCGMTHEEIRKMVSFGHRKQDEDDFDRIGRFGTGFKTGVMRLGRDALVLTQTAKSRSIAFFSQSLNEGKENVVIPLISYQRCKQSTMLDTSILSESLAARNMKAIKEYSPFDEFFIGEKFSKFDRDETGTQIFIWNIDKWGSSTTLDWKSGKLHLSTFHQGDIFTRHRQVRNRHGQVSQKVPLDYSLQAYLEVMFMDPRMKIYVQGSKVKSRPLAKFLSKTVILNGVIMGKNIQLTLGYSKLEWERANCGIFLYWHGRLIEAYKRVGGMIHSADTGRGVIGVIDVSALMDGDEGRGSVHSNKQQFPDCECYSLLVEWLSNKVDAYCDKYCDPLQVEKDDGLSIPDNDWVQCDKCRKWRMQSAGFNKPLPQNWFCYMEPFKGNCSTPEEETKPGVVTVSTRRTGYKDDQSSESSDDHDSEDDPEEEEVEPRKPLKRLTRLRSKGDVSRRKK